MDVISVDLTDDNCLTSNNLITEDRGDQNMCRRSSLDHLVNSPPPVVINYAEESLPPPSTQCSNDIIEIEDGNDDSSSSQTVSVRSIISLPLSECSRDSRSPQPLSEVDSSSSPFICFYCEITFNNYKTFDDHLRKKHSPINETENIVPQKSTKLNCNDCNESFDDKDYLKHRHRIHSRSKNPEDLLQEFSCMKCGKTFLSTQELKIHFDSEHSATEELQGADEEIQCIICGILFESKELLCEHNKTHTSGKTNEKTSGGTISYACQICLELFTTSEDWSKHQVECVTSNGTYYACEFCPSRFLSRRQLITHMRTTHKCDICSQSFATSFLLKKHRKFHDNFTELPKCTFCNSYFTTPEFLKKHMEICEMQPETVNVSNSIGMDINCI